MILIEDKASGTQLIQELREAGVSAVTRYKPEGKILDIAAGHGLFGIAFAKNNPQAEIVALDWAPVLEVAKESARDAIAGERPVRCQANGSRGRVSPAFRTIVS